MIEDKVRVVFSCEEHLSARFKIRLQYDKLQQTQFFKCVIEKYLKNDPRMVQIVQEIKEEKTTMSKKKIQSSAKEHTSADDLMKSLGITDSDKNEIFDLIENSLEDYD